KNRRLPRKSDGMAHHIAYFIHNNTDIVILGIFCGAKEVSVYSIYYSVIILAENFLEAVSAGISGAVGNIIAKRQEETLHSVFNTYSSVNIAVSTFFCTAAAVLVIPFVSVYTDGVTDINYIRPVFACLMLLSLWVYCLRIPFLNVISAAGHYRQTKPGAFMEMFINLGLSLMLVGRFGLCGAAFGTLAAITARLVYSAVYLSRHLIENEVMTLLKKAAVNFAAGAVFASAAITLFDFAPPDITEWFMIAVPVGAASLAFIAGVNCILNKKLVAEVLKKNRK
ncbi:MAG TPA: polysaccharide biosynthesis C-terminal domain-containing protein, partial [Candidatus Ornithomonoglobus intestinigallinarum]|nr:polysaccharide biosynthesis C-terminal domain-containing protein [Candidatus Ornithomonoglobus intestinigallinarum]